MTKNILKILAVFVIGTAGGIFADQIFWPYFVERPLFYKYKLDQTPVNITQKQETTTYIQENVALQKAIEKVEKTVIGVKTKTVDGQILEGSGLVVTSDGLIVTLASLVPQGSDFYFFIDGKWPAYQILKRDFKNNLALVKISDGQLNPAGFADAEKINLGARIFSIGMDFDTATSTILLPPEKTISEGIIARLDKDFIYTNISSVANLDGSPLFDIEGNAVGLSALDQNSKLLAIPISAVRQFLGL